MEVTVKSFTFHNLRNDGVRSTFNLGKNLVRAIIRHFLCQSKLAEELTRPYRLPVSTIMVPSNDDILRDFFLS